MFGERHIIISIFLLLWIGHVFAQIQPIFKRVSVKEGLSNIAIEDIIEDDKGNLWFCTEDGLNKYDSYSFTVYRHMEGDTNSIGESALNTILQDQAGIFWIGTSSRGLVRFEPEFETFKSYLNDPADPHSLSGNGIMALEEDHNGLIWVGTYHDGVSVYDKRTNTFKRFAHDSTKVNSLLNNRILDVTCSKGGDIWILSHGGLSRYNPGRDNFDNFKFEGPSVSWLDRRFQIHEDLYGSIWYGSVNGAVRFDPTTEKRTVYRPKEISSKAINYNFVFEVIQTQDSLYWASTSEGIIGFDKELAEVYHFKSEPGKESALSTNEINKLFEDKHGLIWIGTQNAGIVKANIRKPGFIHYFADESSPVELPGSVMRALMVDKVDRLWIGTMKGDLAVIDKSTNAIRHLKLEPRNGISALYQDSKDRIWVGTWGSGLFYLDNPNSSKFTKFEFNDINQANNDVVQVIKEDKFGNIWVGTELCLNLINPKKGEFKRLLYSNNPSGPFYSIQSNSIDIDSFGHIWVGTFNGLFRFQPSDTVTNSFEADYSIKAYNQELGDNRITVLNYDQEFPNQLLAGTFSDGIRIIHFSNENDSITVESYSKPEGLSSNVVFGVQRDINNFIWASTNYGLSRFDPETKEFANFFDEDGLQDNQFFWGAFSKGTREDLHFGGINGFNVIDTDVIKRDTTKAQVVITGLKFSNQEVTVGERVNGRVLLPKSIAYLDELILDHDHEMFSLEFGAPHHILPEFNRYAYRILGFNDEWVFLDSNKRFITFTNLDPGDYIFQIKSSNYQGIWNETPTSLKITVLTPWWATITFRVISIVMGILLIGSIIYWRTRYLEASKRRLTKQVDEKTKEIRAQHQTLKENLEEKQRVIEQLKLTQNQLIESEKMASIGVLTAGLAHELNNPLSYIGGVVEPIKLDLAEIKPLLSPHVLEEHKETFDEIESLLEGMSFGVVKASEIIKNLLEISPKNNFSQYSNFDLSEMISATVKLVQGSNKDLKFKPVVDKNLQATGNKVELNQVLINIIKNACDALSGHPDGVIEIDAFEKDEKIVIEISDNGPGMDKALISQIFEPFFTTKGPGKGTGLGLYISYTVIKKHNGDIVVESIPNEGTKFILQIPLNAVNISDELSVIGETEPSKP